MNGQKRNPPKKKKRSVLHDIPIKVVNRGTITLGFQGEKYAMAAWKGSTVTWNCNYPFTVLFEPESHIEQPITKTIKKNGKNAWICSTHIPVKPLHFMYKYTVAISIANRVRILDPILVPIPPENRK